MVKSGCDETLGMVCLEVKVLEMCMVMVYVMEIVHGGEG